VNTTPSPAAGGLHVYPDPQSWEAAALAHAAAAHAAGRPEDFRVLAWRNDTVARANAAIRRHIYGPDALPFVAGERLITLGPVKAPGRTALILGASREVTVLKATPTRITGLPAEHYDLPASLAAWDLEIATEEAEHSVTTIDPTAAAALEAWLERLRQEAKKEKGSWAPFWKLRNAVAQLGPAWALTTHRSQGSQYRDVFLHAGDLDANPRPREANRLWYVALTRATHGVHLVVDRPAAGAPLRQAPAPAPAPPPAPAGPVAAPSVAQPPPAGEEQQRRSYLRTLATLQQQVHGGAFTAHQVAVTFGDALPVVHGAADRYRNDQAAALHQQRLTWLEQNGVLSSRRHFRREAVRVPRDLGQEQSDARLRQLEAECGITLWMLTPAGEAQAGSR
jgi:hypothetical protein